MATLFFNSELEKITARRKICIKSKTYKDFIEEVLSIFPDLQGSGLMEMALAIDGEIIHEPFLVAIPDNSELHFVFKISGG